MMLATGISEGVWTHMLNQGGIVTGITLLALVTLALGRWIVLPVMNTWLEITKEQAKIGAMNETTSKTLNDGLARVERMLDRHDK